MDCICSRKNLKIQKISSLITDQLSYHDLYNNEINVEEEKQHN